MAPLQFPVATLADAVHPVALVELQEVVTVSPDKTVTGPALPFTNNETVGAGGTGVFVGAGGDVGAGGEVGTAVAPGGEVGAGGAVGPTHCAAIHAAHVCVFARQAPIHPPQNIWPGGHGLIVGADAVHAPISHPPQSCTPLQ